MDIRKTKDGKFVLCHDGFLHRITGQNEYIENLNYSEVKPILDNIRTGYNDEKNPVKNTDKLKPALLKDVLKMIKGKDILMSVDVKSKKEEDLIEVI